MAWSMGPKREWNRWTEDEDEFLRLNYRRFGCRALVKYLPRHPDPSGICHRARKLGLTTDVGPYGRGRHAKFKVIEGGAYAPKGHRDPHGVQD